MTVFDEPWMMQSKIVKIENQFYLLVPDTSIIVKACGAKEGQEVIAGIIELVDGDHRTFDTEKGEYVEP
ncbi:hypothetical protein ES703_53473 [subsurface metagenome]